MKLFQYEFVIGGETFNVMVAANSEAQAKEELKIQLKDQNLIECGRVKNSIGLECPPIVFAISERAQQYFKYGSQQSWQV